MYKQEQSGVKVKEKEGDRDIGESRWVSFLGNTLHIYLARGYRVTFFRDKTVLLTIFPYYTKKLCKGK